MPLPALAEQNKPVALVVARRPQVTIVLAKDAPPFTRKAAEKLREYLRKISDAEVGIVDDPAAATTPGKIWVGAHPQLAKVHPNVKLDFANAEETLMQTSGADLILVGRDRLARNGVQLEGGTYLVVTSFIENHLGVRWFWPGELGTDIPRKETIQIPSLNERYTTQLKLRRINMVNAQRDVQGLDSEGKALFTSVVADSRQWVKEREETTREWLNNHNVDSPPSKGTVNCIAGPLGDYRARHSGMGWYEKYGKEYPDIFALQPDGSRKPYPSAPYAKLCVSNPQLEEVWLQNARDYFKKNPNATTFEASENDRGWEGYCVCEACLALDNKEAEILERNLKWEGIEKPSYALTDRYVKYWNKIARRLKQEFPGRDVNVSVFAYHPTRPAPTIPVEENIIPAFVGLERRFYNRNSQEHTQEQRAMWVKWWEAVGRRNALVWRPNIFYKNLGLPYIFTQRHAENMRFLADHGLVGIIFGNSNGHWAIQGPQLYLNAKLAYNPRLDAKAVLDDYYQRAYGPAAPHVAQYYQVFEELYAKLAEQYKNIPYNTYFDPPRLFREIRLDSSPGAGRLGKEGLPKHRIFEDRAAALLNEAEKAVAQSDAIHQARVAFLRTGFQFIQLQLDCLEAANVYQNEPTAANLAALKEVISRRDALLCEQINSLAINAPNIWREWTLVKREYGSVKPKKSPRKDRQKKEKQLQEDLEA